MSRITCPCSGQKAPCNTLALCACARPHPSPDTQRTFPSDTIFASPKSSWTISVSSRRRVSAETYRRAPVFGLVSLHLWGRPVLPLEGSSLVPEAAVCYVGSGQVCPPLLRFQLNSVGGGSGSLWHRVLGFLGDSFVLPDCKQKSVLRKHFFFKLPKRTKRLPETQIHSNTF